MSRGSILEIRLEREEDNLMKCGPDCPDYMDENCDLNPEALIECWTRKLKIGENFIEDVGVVLGGLPSSGLDPVWGIEIGDNVRIGANSVIMRGVNGPTVIGNDVQIGALVNVGHDCQIGDRTKILNGTMIAGHVKIKALCWIGMGCRFREKVTVGEGSLIGMGSNVTKDIPQNVIAWGNPCQVIKRRLAPVKFYLRGLGHRF